MCCLARHVVDSGPPRDGTSPPRSPDGGPNVQCQWDSCDRYELQSLRKDTVICAPVVPIIDRRSDVWIVLTMLMLIPLGAPQTGRSSPGLCRNSQPQPKSARLAMNDRRMGTCTPTEDEVREREATGDHYFDYGLCACVPIGFHHNQPTPTTPSCPTKLRTVAVLDRNVTCLSPW